MVRTEPRLAAIANRLFAASLIGVTLGLASATTTQASSKGDTQVMEFTSAEPMTLSYAWQIGGEVLAASRVSGGWVKGRVETREVDGAIVKQVVGLDPEDVTVELDLAAMPGAVAEWISESWEKRYSWRTGSLVEMDALMGEARVREFYDAHITEVRLPLLDASSKEPASATLRFSPQFVDDGPPQAPLAVAPDPVEREWTNANFEIEIGSLPCAGILRVDEIVVARTSDADDAPFEVANLVLRFPADDAGPWADWFESFVIEGNSTEANELNGSITFLSPDHEEELGRIHLSQVGIVALSIDAEAGAAAGFDVVRAELYVEGVQLDFGGADR